MSDKWEELLRKKLENYEVEPPPGVWEGICEKMGIDPVTLEKKPAVSRWWWAAAAVVLALVGCFVVYEMSDSDLLLQADAVSQQQSSLLPSSEPVLAQQSPSQQQEDVVTPRSKSLISRSLSLRPNQRDRLLDDVAEPQSKTCPLDSATTEVAQQQEEPTEPQQQPSSAKPSEYEVFNDPEPPAVYEASASQAKWSVALKASGGLLAANNSVQTDRFYQPMSDYNGSNYYDWNKSGGVPGSNIGYTEMDSSTFYTVTEHVMKHHLPLRFGLSLQYQLHPRLALLSGVSYTRLSSEISYPLYPNISYSQRLHYIGIPLGVAWQLWTANRFSFYCSGGAMVEKCVSVSLNGDYSGKKPWQWSVHAAAGAEYTFIPSLGAYIEPSLGYYFSDGTQLEHYYKEHPLAPSIEFGLRFHMGK
jgi:hypothetical protein